MFAVGQIDHIRNTGQFLGVNAVLDLFNNLFRAHHIRQFSHHNTLFTGGHLLNRDLGTGLERAAPAFVGILNTAQSHNRAAAGQIRAGNELHNLFERGIRVRNQMPRTRNNLAQVMRSHVRCHTHRNAGRTIDQQVRERRWQHARLHELVIVVRHKINNVFVKIRSQRRRCGGHTCLRVAGSRRAVVKRTKVTVPIHQWQAHRKRLRQTHHRIVNSGIAVRVQFTHDLAGHTGTLHMPLIRAQPHLLHHVEDAPLHRFQPVARIRQSTRINNRVGVLQKAGFHLGRDINIDNIFDNINRVIFNGGLAAACHFSP